MPTATNIDLHSAQKITKLEDNEVLVSIANCLGPAHENVSIEGFNDKILKVRFDDVTANFQHNGEIFTPIGGETAVEIVKFAETNKNKNFIIHCHAGISRSAAVCLFMNLVYGHKLKDNFWETSHPNPLVLGMLMIIHSKYRSFFTNLSL